MSEISTGYTKDIERTLIYRNTGNSEIALGYVDTAGVIFRLRWDQSLAVGRVTGDRKVLRYTRYDERELGLFTERGSVFSLGLLEGGALGWVEDDGVVIRAGLIFGEEEVGRVEGNDKVAAGAALLLLFLVDEFEETNRSNR